jgi:hypothetical protein
VRALGLLLGQRAEDHDHVPALDERVALDDGDVLELRGHAVEKLASELLMNHLAAAEHDRELDLVPVLEKVLDVPELGAEVVVADLGTELHLLQADKVVLLAGVLLALEGVELEASIVHEAAHRRLCHRRHLDQIELPLDRQLPGPLHGNDPESLARCVIEESNAGDSDLLIDPELTKCDGVWSSKNEKNWIATAIQWTDSWTSKVSPGGGAPLRWRTPSCGAFRRRRGSIPRGS